MIAVRLVRLGVVLAVAVAAIFPASAFPADQSHRADDRLVDEASIHAEGWVSIRLLDVDDPQRRRTGSRQFRAPQNQTVWVRPEVIIDSADIRDARADGDWRVRVRLTRDGRKKLSAAVDANQGGRLAFFVGERIVNISEINFPGSPETLVIIPADVRFVFTEQPFAVTPHPTPEDITRAERLAASIRSALPRPR